MIRTLEHCPGLTLSRVEHYWVMYLSIPKSLQLHLIIQGVVKNLGLAEGLHSQGLCCCILTPAAQLSAQSRIALSSCCILGSLRYILKYAPGADSQG